MCKRAVATGGGVALILLSLSGCGQTTGLVPQIAVSAQVIYPNLPDLTAPTKLPAKPVQFSPPTQSTNFVGLDYANWVNLAYDIKLLQQREFEWQAILTQINQERADWRNKNTPPIPPTPPTTSQVK